MYFTKNTLKKYDLQESYNNFRIKLKIYFCESTGGPWFHHQSKEWIIIIKSSPQ